MADSDSDDGKKIKMQTAADLWGEDSDDDYNTGEDTDLYIHTVHPLSPPMSARAVDLNTRGPVKPCNLDLNHIPFLTHSSPLTHNQYRACAADEMVAAAASKKPKKVRSVCASEARG